MAIETSAINLIKAHLENKFGKTFEQLKPEMKQKAEKYCLTCEGDDGWLRCPEAGFTLFYNANPNFKQGAKNGGGLGYFAALKGLGMSRTIRMESAENYK